MKKDIQLIINQGEYMFAYELLSGIMDIFITPIYWDDCHWYGMRQTYRDLTYDLIEKDGPTVQKKKHLMSHVSVFSDIVF